MDLDDDTVGTRGYGGQRKRRYDVYVPGRVAWVDDDGKVAVSLDHRNGGDVERVARRPFKGPNPAFAQNYLRVSDG